MLLFDDTAGSERVKLRSQKDLMFKALNNEQRDIGANQTENVGGDETITVGGPTGGGNFTLNAFQTATINVGPIGSPMTQIKMDTSSITLNVGPDGMATQIVMNMDGHHAKRRTGRVDRPDRHGAVRRHDQRDARRRS